MGTREVYEIAALVVKSLRGTLREEEEERLRRWAAESAENGALLERLQNAEVREEELERMFSRDVRGGWERVVRKAEERRKRRRRAGIWKRAGSVAAAVAIVAGGVWVMQQEGERVDAVAEEKAGITSGRTLALLTVADGKCYELGENTTEIPNTLVRRGDKVLFGGNDSLRAKGGVVRFNKLEIPRGGEYRIVLDDGTVVYLNSQTELRFPEHFAAEGVREVYLEGEAFFEVAKDGGRPFVVRCGKYDVQVTGTAFNVSNYADDAYSHTTLAEGAVTIVREGGETKLHPGEQARLEDGKLEVRKVNVEDYTTWMNAHFRFGSEHMEELLKRLGRWYEVEVFYVNPEVKNYHFSGYLPRYSEIGDVLKLLEMTTNIRFDIKGKTVRVMKK